jgi:hypothetical protein
VRHLQFEHHNGDDDCKDTIAESSKAIFSHSPIPVGGQY